jgi:hypothetical protein
LTTNVASTSIASKNLLESSQGGACGQNLCWFWELGQANGLTLESLKNEGAQKANEKSLSCSQQIRQVVRGSHESNLR